MYDVLIIGGGPAGMAAAIYASRAGLSTLLLERAFTGGQIVNTPTVENYPGFETAVSGADIAIKMRKQVELMGAQIISEEAKSLQLRGEVKRAVTSKNEYEAKTVILAMGAVPRALGVKGEFEFGGSGVSFCATCDGALFKERDVAVIGGGNTAVEDALYLSKLCRKVYLVHRRDKFRAQSMLVEAARKIENIEFVTESIVTEIAGEFAVKHIHLENVHTHENKTIDVAGVFIAVGQIPKTALVEDQIELDDKGYISAREDCMTAIEGVFAAGDIRTKKLRQIVTAVADGAVAATAAEGYLIEY